MDKTPIDGQLTWGKSVEKNRFRFGMCYFRLRSHDSLLTIVNEKLSPFMHGLVCIRLETMLSETLYFSLITIFALTTDTHFSPLYIHLQVEGVRT